MGEAKLRWKKDQTQYKQAKQQERYIWYYDMRCMCRDYYSVYVNFLRVYPISRHDPDVEVKTKFLGALSGEIAMIILDILELIVEVCQLYM